MIFVDILMRKYHYYYFFTFHGKNRYVCCIFFLYIILIFTFMIHIYIYSTRPTDRAYLLQTTFPVKELTDLDKTLKEAGLLNSVVVQRYQ